MKKTFLFLFSFITIAVFAQQKIAPDSDAQKRTLNASFTGISVSDGIAVYLTQSNEESVAVSAADEKYLERFKTEVENGVLKIYFDNKSINWSSNNKRKLTAFVSFKTLQKLNASGGAAINFEGIISVENLEIKSSSGSSLQGPIKATELIVNQSSGSNIDITGTVNRLTVAVSSGAEFKSFDLAADYCNAKASSGGGVRITVNKELNAKASSGGGVKYKGDGVIKDISVSSGGSVKKA